MILNNHQSDVGRWGDILRDRGVAINLNGEPGRLSDKRAEKPVGFFLFFSLLFLSCGECVAHRSSDRTIYYIHTREKPYIVYLCGRRQFVSLKR